MQKHSVPAAPVPSWAVSANKKSVASQQSGLSSRSASPLLPPLDADFLRGTYKTLLWFGAWLTIVAGAMTQSLLVAWSFAAGVALAAGLLKTQEIFAHYLVQQATLRRAAKQVLTGRQVRLPMHAFSGIKYLIVGALLWLLLGQGWLWPVPFALGFTTLQVVIAGRALGHLFNSRKRSLREVYVRPRRSTL